MMVNSNRKTSVSSGGSELAPKGSLLSHEQSYACSQADWLAGASTYLNRQARDNRKSFQRDHDQMERIVYSKIKTRMPVRAAHAASDLPTRNEKMHQPRPTVRPTREQNFGSAGITVRCVSKEASSAPWGTTTARILEETFAQKMARVRQTVRSMVPIEQRGADNPRAPNQERKKKDRKRTEIHNITPRLLSVPQ